MISLSIIVAMAKNQTIGRENGLPWHLPEDLKHFKQITMGHPIIMGRKTFESIGRPLPGRTNIVVTRNKSWSAEGVTVSYNLEDAIKSAEKSTSGDTNAKAFIIGGAELYCQALPQVNRLYLTEVHEEVEGDAFFPVLNIWEWEEVSRSNFESSVGNPYSYSFVILDRKK